jgi:hypothetical protein
MIFCTSLPLRDRVPQRLRDRRIDIKNHIHFGGLQRAETQSQQLYLWKRQKISIQCTEIHEIRNITKNYQCEQHLDGVITLKYFKLYRDVALI